MSFIQRFGRCVYVKATPEPNYQNEEENQEEKQLSSDLYVDLGLPSGTLWYNMNLGADSPLKRGLYFSWGNLEGHQAEYIEGDYSGTIINYSFITSSYELTSGSQLSGNIPVENDAAANILGDDWRIPTYNQFQELLDNCTMEITTIDGIRGKLFTSNINGNVIFFPNNGYGNGTTLSYPKFEATYWTNVEDTEDTNNAYALSLGNTVLPSLNIIHPEEKRFGFGIRAVKI